MSLGSQGRINNNKQDDQQHVLYHPVPWSGFGINDRGTSIKIANKNSIPKQKLGHAFPEKAQGKHRVNSMRL
jgi:hypothetical protein